MIYECGCNYDNFVDSLSGSNDRYIDNFVPLGYRCIRIIFIDLAAIYSAILCGFLARLVFLPLHYMLRHSVYG